MPISYEKKTEQTPRVLGEDINQWPREPDTVWRVTAPDNRGEFQLGDLLLVLYSRGNGWAMLNLRSNALFACQVPEGRYVKIVQDFSVKNVTLYVDNSAMP